MSPWLFDIYMDGCMREMKVRVQDLGARLNVRGVEQPLVAGLFKARKRVHFFRGFAVFNKQLQKPHFIANL